MSMIYTPAGKAREYSPKALNIYLTCTHHCEYCYAPRCRWQTAEEYFVSPSPRKDIVKKLDEELEKGELSLEDSVSKFEEGIKISKECNKTLEEAEKKITILVNQDGEMKENDFET